MGTSFWLLGTVAGALVVVEVLDALEAPLGLVGAGELAVDHRPGVLVHPLHLHAIRLQLHAMRLAEPVVIA